MCEYKIVIGSQEAGRSNTHDSQAIKLGLVFWMTCITSSSDTDTCTSNCVLHYTGLMKE